MTIERTLAAGVARRSDRGSMPVHLLATALVAVLSIAITVTTTAVEAESDTACKVRNQDNGQGYDGLRPALAAASAGDTLTVMGTCYGSFVIRKPVRLAGVRGISETLDFDSGPPKIRTRSGRAALIIAPRVDAFEVEAGVRIKGGVVIARPGSDRAKAKLNWILKSPWRAGVAVDYVRTCRPTGQERNLRIAVASGDDDDISFFGKCWGRLRINEPTHITGDRYFASSMPLAKGKISRSESGKPMVRSKMKPGIIVDRAVDALVLEGFVIRDGLRIGPGLTAP